MKTPLLQTKFYIPPARPEFIPRPHLIKRLNDGLQGKLTLVSAPAGFGKTTLLGRWITGGQATVPVAWLSLDENDNDPARFLAYLSAALQTVEADIGPGMQDMLQIPPSPPVESILTLLINDVAAFSGKIALVLDDYHLIAAPPIHEGLAFLLNHLPGNMHLIIATRADPPLPLARLRGQGQLTELRQLDLRFSPAETAEFLKRIFGVDLPAADLAALNSRTEGWVAGLQLASIALQTRLQQAQLAVQPGSPTTDFVQTFTGSNRYVLDYLVEEVLEHQPESIEAFLLRTAILDRLNDSLCDAVIEEIGDWRNDLGSQIRLPAVALFPETNESISRRQSRSILNYLEASNLFIVPLDNERHWYRYHHLFADLLRKRLDQTRPELVPILHNRASNWYVQNGFMAAAIDHALSAENFERAAELIEQIAEATLMRGEVLTLLSWLEMLPAALVRVRPTLSLFHAWTLLLTGRPLERIEAGLQDIDEDSELMRSKVALLRAFIAILQGQLPGAASLSRQILEQLPPDDWFLRSVATWILTVSQGSDDYVAVRLLNEVAGIGQQTGNLLVAVQALIYLARLRMRQGQLHRAKMLCHQALELASDKQGHPLPVAAEALMGLGELSREWNSFEEATRQLLAGIDLSRQLGNVTAMPGYISLARLKQAQGDLDGARELLQKAQHLARQFDAATWWNEPIVALSQARLWIDQGNLKAALGWTRQRGLVLPTPHPEGVAPQAEASRLGVNLAGLEDKETPINRLRKYEYLVLARLLLVQGRFDEALGLLVRLLPLVERLGRTRLVIEIELLTALVCLAKDKVEQAQNALGRALTLAEPEGYVRLFVDEGPPLVRLLQRAIERGIVPDYASRLLATIEVEAARPPGPRDKQALSPTLVEPLSERELQVLQLLAQGLKYREIAGQLFISLNTVRHHAKNIYTKFNVNNRLQAIARAKELNLL